MTDPLQKPAPVHASIYLSPGKPLSNPHLPVQLAHSHHPHKGASLLERYCAGGSINCHLLNTTLLQKPTKNVADISEVSHMPKNCLNRFFAEMQLF